MAQRGRPPKPIEQKRLAGNPGRRPLPAVGLAVVAPVERGPLDWRAVEVFEATIEAGRVWLAESDALKLVMLRERLEEREALRDAVMAGVGDRKQLRDLERQIDEAGSLLGFDPAARSRLGLAEVRAASKLEAIRASQEKRVASTVVDVDDAG